MTAAAPVIDLPDFDSLCSAAFFSDTATIDDKNRLWAAVWLLPEWHFIAQADFPDVRPFIAKNKSVGNGGYMLVAFTDTQKLSASVHELGLLDADGKVSFLSMPTDGLLATIARYAELGVEGIHFNSDSKSSGFFAPLDQLPIIVAHLVRIGLLPDDSH